jgi:hypothetical protein
VSPISLRKLRSETARIDQAVNANAAVFNEQVLPLLERHTSELAWHDQRFGIQHERLLALEALVLGRLPGPTIWSRLCWLVTGRG